MQDQIKENITGWSGLLLPPVMACRDNTIVVAKNYAG